MRRTAPHHTTDLSRWHLPKLGFELDHQFQQQTHLERAQRGLANRVARYAVKVEGPDRRRCGRRRRRCGRRRRRCHGRSPLLLPATALLKRPAQIYSPAQLRMGGKSQTHRHREVAASGLLLAIWEAPTVIRSRELMPITRLGCHRGRRHVDSPRIAPACPLTRILCTFAVTTSGTLWGAKVVDSAAQRVSPSSLRLCSVSDTVTEAVAEL